LERLGSDERAAKHAERALGRSGRHGAEAALSALPGAGMPLRARLVRVLGRLAAEGGDAVRAALLAHVADPEPKVKKSAVIALGKIGGPGVETALVAAWPEADLPLRRALAEALGKVGGPAARECLEHAHSDDPELERLRVRALAMLGRTLERAPSEIATDIALPVAATVVLRCRSGLESLLADELGARGLAGARRERAGELRLAWSGPLAPLLEIRLALSVALEVPRVPAATAEDSVVATLLGPCLPLLESWTRGQPRFRASWADAGHQRRATWNIAVRLRGTALVNDPHRAPWEVQIERERLLLVPRGAPDTRFDYRVRLVPAASHPTIAAALARLSGALPSDVVWDPFVGSGLELVERARLGPFRRLFGSDIDQRALAAARENLSRANVAAELVLGDARELGPRGVTSIITNPPMGRRVARDGSLAPLLDSFLANASRVLAPGGRIAWLSPLPDRTARRLDALGLTVERHAALDMGGFEVEPQLARRRPL
jgi:23S rRNA G2445 N2-methylase RlmL